MLGKKYTDEVIAKRAAERGFIVIGVDRDREVPLVGMQCKKGHKRAVNADTIQAATCQICNGKRYDLPKAERFLKSMGYKFKEIPELSIDRHGNDVLKAVTRFVAICPEGHEYSTNLTGLGRGDRCTLCSGTAANAGYSRSEEIIAKTLDYNGITYTRQKDIEVDDERVYVDFYLPGLELILEYDGAHHVYGRSDGTEDDLAEVQRKDSLRDVYAKRNSLNLVRIYHTVEGKQLVYALAKLLPEISIDTEDPYYDIIVMDVFNESSKRFGWLTYDDMKKNAIAYLYNSLSDASSITGASQTVIARHFKRVYGMNKEDYLKKLRGGEVEQYYKDRPYKF